MFTGLVEGMGQVVSIVNEGAGVRLTINPPAAMVSRDDPVRLGDSIAINGCCLTVIDIMAGTGWSFQAGSETLAKTSLGSLVLGNNVNLERSMRADQRIGGHFVQGHIDGVGTVSRIETEGDWVFMSFQVPASLAELTVMKGSIAVDGVSLTLAGVGPNEFRIALIPHTLAVTTLGQRKPGDTVNIETDILGKYVQKLLAGSLARG